MPQTTVLMPARLPVLLLSVSSLLFSSAPALELRRAPYLQVQRSEGITIRWRTDDTTKGPALVRYGSTPNSLEHAVVARELPRKFPGIIDWQATITKLKPNTRYFYSVEVAQVTLAGADDEHTFRTAPPTGQPAKLRFWLFGDSGSNRPREGDAAAVLKLSAPSGPVKVRNGFRRYNNGQPLDGIILLGDNAYPRGTDSEYQVAFFGLYRRELGSTPLWPCVGNHDLDGAYPHLFTVPSEGHAGGGVPSRNPLYYSFTIAHVHVIVLDPWMSWWETTTDPKHPAWTKQVAWLKRDLAAGRHPWTIVVNHFPLFCDGDYNSDTNGPLKLLREQLAPLLEEAGVDLVLAGHDHTYQRSYLIDGHYGTRAQFNPRKHLKSRSDGRESPILKGAGPHQGTIYVVSGTGGGSRPGGAFAHPVMVPFGKEKEGKPAPRGLPSPGSFLLEIDGMTLSGTQIDVNGKVLDRFVLKKTLP